MSPDTARFFAVFELIEYSFGEVDSLSLWQF
jgi:hypothetical protein